MNNETNTWPDAQTLIETLQLKDKKLRRSVIDAKGVTAVFGLSYLVFMIINPDNFFGTLDLIGNILAASGLIIMSLYFLLLQKKIATVQYDAPLLVVLKQTVKRLRFNIEFTWLSVFSIILSDAGISTSMYQDRLYYTVWEWLLISQAVACLLAIVAIGVSYLVWKRNTKPLLDNVLGLIEELEG